MEETIGSQQALESTFFSADSAVPYLSLSAEKFTPGGFKLTVPFTNDRTIALDAHLLDVSKLPEYPEMADFIRNALDDKYQGTLALRMFQGVEAAHDKGGTLTLLTPAVQEENNYTFMTVGALHSVVETVNGVVKQPIELISPLTCSQHVQARPKSCTMKYRGKVVVLSHDARNMPSGVVELPCGRTLDLLGSKNADLVFCKVIYSAVANTPGSPIETTVVEPVIDLATGQQSTSDSPSKRPLWKEVRKTPFMVPSSSDPAALVGRSMAVIGYASYVSHVWAGHFALAVADMMKALERAAKEVTAQYSDTAQHPEPAVGLQQERQQEQTLAKSAADQCATTLERLAALLGRLPRQPGDVGRESLKASQLLMSAGASLVALADVARQLDADFLRDEVLPMLQHVLDQSQEYVTDAAAAAPVLDAAAFNGLLALITQINISTYGKATIAIAMVNGAGAIPEIPVLDEEAAQNRLSIFQDTVMHRYSLAAGPGKVLSDNRHVLLHSAPVIPGFSGGPGVDINNPRKLWGIHIQSQHNPFDPCSFAIQVQHPCFASQYIKHVLPFLGRVPSYELGDDNIAAIHEYVDLFENKWDEWGVRTMVDSFRATFRRRQAAR